MEQQFIGPNGTVVTVVGTIHTWAPSAALARDAVEREQPDIVILELCSARTLGKMPSILSALGDKPGFVWPGFTAFAAAAVASLTTDIYTDSGTVVGDEFTAAWRSAEALGARVLAGDRNVYVTGARLFLSSQRVLDRYATVSALDALGLVWGLVTGNRASLAASMRHATHSSRALRYTDELEANFHIPTHRMLQRRVYDAMDDAWIDVIQAGGKSMTFDQYATIQRHFHTLAAADEDLPSERIREVVTVERDEILAHSLWLAACEAKPRPGQGVARVVGVVGAGHLPGITQLWGRTTSDHVSQLLQPPQWYLQASFTGPVVGTVAGVVAWKYLFVKPVRRGILGLGALSVAATGVSVYNVLRLKSDLKAAYLAAKTKWGPLDKELGTPLPRKLPAVTLPPMPPTQATPSPSPQSSTSSTSTSTSKS